VHRTQLAMLYNRFYIPYEITMIARLVCRWVRSMA